MLNKSLHSHNLSRQFGDFSSWSESLSFPSFDNSEIIPNIGFQGHSLIKRASHQLNMSPS